jgi:hypothetical protein
MDENSIRDQEEDVKNKVQHRVRWRITDHGGTSWPRFMLWQRIWGFWFYRGAKDHMDDLLQFIPERAGYTIVYHNGRKKDETADNYY